MLGLIRNKIKLSVLRAFDSYGRNHSGTSRMWPDPNVWDMTPNKEGHLAIDEIDLVDLADSYKTPLHVVNTSRLKKNYFNFLDCFTRHYSRIEIGYSYKTNPLPAVISKLHEFGASAEVISHFELWLALRLGVPPEKIIYNGPGKSVESLDIAVKKGIKIINIDSMGEIDTLDTIAEKYGIIQPVGIRVVTSVGWSGQFGLSISSGAAWQAVDKIKQKPHLKLVGLHFHLGTGIKDVTIYLQAIVDVLEFDQKLRRKAGINVKFLDFGGGFGIPSVAPYTSLDHRLMSAGFPPWLPDFASPSPMDH